MFLMAANGGGSHIKDCGHQFGSEGNVHGKLGGVGTHSLLLICNSTAGSLQTLLCPGLAGSQLPRKTVQRIYNPRTDALGTLWSFKIWFLQSAPSLFIAESPGFEVLFPSSCRALPVPHPPQSQPTHVCTLQLSPLFLHAVPLLATLPPFVSTSLPSILPLHCLCPSQLTLYCHTPDLLKF